MLTEIKFILSNLHISGAAITRKALIAGGNGVLSARCPGKMAVSGGSIAY